MAFSSTSLIEYLTCVTGLDKVSFYYTFGARRALYIRALEFYANREITAAVAMLNDSD
jgi:hypothetical protein